MSPLRNLLSAVLFFVVPVSAGPTITNIANAAGNLPFNSPLAPGGIFILQGSGLGPSTISIASKPFQSTTLSGTSVSVTVGTTTVAALMYYTSDKQVAALLPSNTPTTGPGTFTVTYNGQTSNNAGHGIATANAGIFTIDSSGQGPGIFTYADYSLVSAIKSANCGGPNTTCGAANPGDTLIIWATGLGAVNGDDASGAGLGVNMPNLPLSLWVGGIKANVLYQGRSGCCVGEDQIVFTVPDNARLGCAVPVVIQIGTNANTISNSVVLPIAKGSRKRLRFGRRHQATAFFRRRRKVRGRWPRAVHQHQLFHSRLAAFRSFLGRQPAIRNVPRLQQPQREPECALFEFLGAGCRSSGNGERTKRQREPAFQR